MYDDEGDRRAFAMTIGRQSDYVGFLMEGRQSALERLHKSSISVKDISSQFWCEKQMELRYTHPKTANAKMERGTKLHQGLQVEVFVPLTLEPASYADRMYKTAYENIMSLNTLMKEGMARELMIYGSISGYRIIGQIDELRIRNGSLVIVENKTTARNRELSREYTLPHIVQVMIYRRALGEMRDGVYSYKNFSVSNRLSEMKMTEQFSQGLKQMNLRPESMSLEGIYQQMFETVAKLPGISDSLLIDYIDRERGDVAQELTIKYEAKDLENQLIYAMKYWSGQREAQPVPENEVWKCRICPFFGKECTVWSAK